MGQFLGPSLFACSTSDFQTTTHPKQPVIQTAFLQVPAHLRVDEPASLPSHTSEQLLDELMLKLTGFRIETSQYVEEIV